MKFKSIKIGKWRQFDTVEVNFHPRLTLLTGANGSGKTTILNLLNNHFGWPLSFVGTPRKNKISGAIEYITDVWKSIFRDQRATDKYHIGSIKYSNGESCSLTLPSSANEVYNVQYSSKHGIKGLHIPSHRPLYTYKKVSNIPTQPFTKKEAFNKYSKSIKRRYQGGHSESANFHIKETLISLGALGFGNEVVQRNNESVSIFENFQEILRIVLPPQLGFKKLEIRMPEVVLVTDSGDFSIDAVSGGIAAIIDLAWQIFTVSEKRESLVVTIDEPENHLHPEMQRTLLPNLLRAFPNVQFIAATHNPFIISSESNSNVFVLDYDDENKVNSIYLDNVEKAGTANEILREVLGIESTTPVWVNKKLNEIIKKYSSEGINKDNLDKFKQELKDVGLEKYIPTSIANLIEEEK